MRPIPSLAACLVLFSAAPAAAEFPLGRTFPDCGLGGDCPPDYSPWGHWNLGSTIPEPIPAGRIPAAEAAIGSGLWADRAWNRTVGDPRVLIAVLDSGIKWDDSQTLRKHFLHRGELPLPQTAAGVCADYDCNGDGVFNIDDWADDPRVAIDAGVNATSHPDAVLDPSDLIAVFSDGVDDDGNGYVDDISGWDFFWNDNNPYDDTRYGHGTGEAQDSAAEAGNGGDIGVCPDCMVLDLRVGDSFVADVNHFGSAVLYATDLGAHVIQEALGTLNNTPLAVAAIEYAWDHGLAIVASAADETAYHQNYPANNHHTLYVHALRYDTDSREDTTTFLSYSNCTNHGPRLVLSAPSTSCSSGATGVSAGVAGLLFSAALEAGYGQTMPALTGNEVYQLLALSYDDVARTPYDDDPDYYPSFPGWDSWFGYGRINARRVVDKVLDGDIPPEADILEPTWFEYRASGTLDVVGLAAANRSTGYTWELQAAAGGDPRDEDFVVLASGDGTTPTEGVLASIPTEQLPGDPQAPPPTYGPEDDAVSKERKAFASGVTLRLQVRDAEGRLGEMRKLLFVRDDPDLLPGYPRRGSAGGIDGSPTLVDLDGDGVDEVLWASSEGWLHATDATLTDKPGWPVALPLIDPLDPDSARNHLAQQAFASGDVDAAQRHPAIATPAVGDLDGDGTLEVVAATLSGAVMVWGADGAPRAGFPFWPDRTLVEGQTDPDNVWDYGFFASPALGDLDADGDLEIVLGAMDSRVYALQADGALVPGFPVELRETYTTSDGPRSNGERIVSSPALGDVDGDGTLEIAIGTNQKTTGTYGLAYLLHHDGTIADGWPAALFGAYTNALPYVGEGVPGSPTMCDVDGDGTLEIAVHTIADSGKLFRGDGELFANLARVAPDFGSYSNTDEGAANLIMINSGAWGDLDADGKPDYVIGSTGFEYANGLLDDGFRYDHDHLLSAWSGDVEDGAIPKMPFLRGFPQIMEDLQFFLNPAIADLDGDGYPEAITGSAGNVVHAFDREGFEPAGWPKVTGQWVLGSAGIGDADGDGLLEVWVGTRSGFLFAWRTAAVAATAKRDWTGFRHDPMNTGNCKTPLRSYPPIAVPIDEAGCGCQSRVGGRGGAVALALLALCRRRRGAQAARLPSNPSPNTAPNTTTTGR